MRKADAQLKLARKLFETKMKRADQQRDAVALWLDGAGLQGAARVELRLHKAPRCRGGDPRAEEPGQIHIKAFLERVERARAASSPSACVARFEALGTVRRFFIPSYRHLTRTFRGRCM